MLNAKCRHIYRKDVWERMQCYLSADRAPTQQVMSYTWRNESLTTTFKISYCPWESHQWKNFRVKRIGFLTTRWSSLIKFNPLKEVGIRWKWINLDDKEALFCFGAMEANKLMVMHMDESLTGNIISLI